MGYNGMVKANVYDELLTLMMWKIVEIVSEEASFVIKQLRLPELYELVHCIIKNK
ncbi:hypothetical protein [Paenibacillus antarcticus]|uniref:hypothetical protein n=1 Tax=Paenibacillus antarcticus TaxID=253703 RepID=UPI000A7B2252|nr:hypothetical protein [Paenibacillus antarcticus]